jgi:DNA-binding response OmpR family regulator
MHRVLVVEDEDSVRDYLVSVLVENGFEVLGVASGEQALESLAAFEPQLLLIDQRLPGAAGTDVIAELRRRDRFRFVPIIMVTGVDTEDDKVKALELGADDYIVKPFLPKELAARARAVLRRSQERYVENPVLSEGSLRVDLAAHAVFLNGQPIHLTLTEYRILAELVRNKGAVLSRDKLRQNALGSLNVTDRTIDVHMASLRKKLGSTSDNIHTVRGVGYRFS